MANYRIVPMTGSHLTITTTIRKHDKSSEESAHDRNLRLLDEAEKKIAKYFESLKADISKFEEQDYVIDNVMFTDMTKTKLPEEKNEEERRTRE